MSTATLKKESLREYVKRTNKMFKKASPKRKRVMIAKDTIRRMEDANFSLEPGTFIRVPVRTDYIQFSTFINNSTDKKCIVCAKGALFCSLIGRVNKLDTEMIRRSGDLANEESSLFHEKLSEYFSMEQLDLIETAFEGNSYLDTNINHRPAECFYAEYDSSEERLKNICKNIIKNKGQFIP